MPAAALLACFVIGIADGDTLTARCEAAAAVATNVVVRLAGIDAPERRQAFGQRSRQNLAVLCFKKQAEIHPVATDRYGRTVARVMCDRVDASAQQVRVGLAWAYTRYDTDKSATKLERGARATAWSVGRPFADPSVGLEAVIDGSVCWRPTLAQGLSRQRRAVIRRYARPSIASPTGAVGDGR